MNITGQLFVNKQTNKNTNKQIHNKKTNLNMVIMWLSCDDSNMIILYSYNIMIIWWSFIWLLSDNDLNIFFNEIQMEFKWISSRNFNKFPMTIHWKVSWNLNNITMEIHWKSSWNFKELPTNIHWKSC